MGHKGTSEFLANIMFTVMLAFTSLSFYTEASETVSTTREVLSPELQDQIAHFRELARAIKETRYQIWKPMIDNPPESYEDLVDRSNDSLNVHTPHLYPIFKAFLDRTIRQKQELEEHLIALNMQKQLNEVKVFLHQIEGYVLVTPETLTYGQYLTITFVSENISQSLSPPSSLLKETVPYVFTPELTHYIFLKAKAVFQTSWFSANRGTGEKAFALLPRVLTNESLSELELLFWWRLGAEIAEIPESDKLADNYLYPPEFYRQHDDNHAKHRSEFRSILLNYITRLPAGGEILAKSSAQRLLMRFINEIDNTEATGLSWFLDYLQFRLKKSQSFGLTPERMDQLVFEVDHEPPTDYPRELSQLSQGPFLIRTWESKTVFSGLLNPEIKKKFGISFKDVQIDLAKYRDVLALLRLKSKLINKCKSLLSFNKVVGNQ